jgi:uncharacterized protein (DUF849 family)
MEPAVICVAPTGARRSKADHPNLPLTPAEIAREAVACAEAGARVLHLHVRDAAGAHSLAAADYRPAIDAVTAAAGDALIVQITTEAVGRYTRQEQMALVRELRPAAVSIALRELAPDAAAETEALEFYAWAEANGVGVQHIVYFPEEAARLAAVTAGFSRKPAHALFVLGRYTSDQESDQEDLPPFLDCWPEGWPWTVCAFGRRERDCLAGAIRLGGHVRVGFENNLLRPDGTPAASNAEQVAGIRDAAIAAGRPLATTSQARALYCAPAAP